MLNGVIVVRLPFCLNGWLQMVLTGKVRNQWEQGVCGHWIRAGELRMFLLPVIQLLGWVAWEGGPPPAVWT
jgi:hypothetical protein